MLNDPDKKNLELPTEHENTSRALHMAVLTFLATVPTIIRFQESEIIHTLDKKVANVGNLRDNETQFAGKCSELHSKNGVRLSIKQITDSFRIFLFRIESQLARIGTRISGLATLP